MAREGLMDDSGYDPDSFCCENCANCGNRDCEWYDNWLDDEDN